MALKRVYVLRGGFGSMCRSSQRRLSRSCSVIKVALVDWRHFWRYFVEHLDPDLHLNVWSTESVYNMVCEYSFRLPLFLMSLFVEMGCTVRSAHTSELTLLRQDKTRGGPVAEVPIEINGLGDVDRPMRLLDTKSSASTGT